MSSSEQYVPMGSDETVDYLCTPCEKKSILKPATKHCDECSHYYCVTCTDTHNDVNSHHTLKNPVDFPFMLSETNTTEKCLAHKELLDMYCMAHDDIGCKRCISLEHQSCSGVYYIPVMVDKLVITKAPSEIIEQLRKEKLRMDGVKENNAKVLKELSASRKKAIESIKHFRKGLEIVLDHLENASLVEIETEYSAKEISVKNQLQISSHNIQRLEQAYKAMKIAEQLNKTQRFVNIKSAEKSLRTLEQIDQTESTEPQSVLNAFELNTNIYKYLKDLRSFSQIGTFKNEQTLLNEHKSTDINVEVSGESCSLINGSCFTPDGVLLLSDHNGKLKRVDPRRGCVTDYYNLANGPWGVCCIGKDLAAVCLDNDTVQLISLSKKMTLLKELKFKHSCYGVASSESELFISDHAETVYIYDMAGKELGKLDCGNTYPIRLMAYDDTTSRLYIAAGDKMLAYDKLGSRMIIFKDPRINGITSVCTDKKGNAYLCGSLSNNVIRVGQDGRKIEEIVRSSDGIVNPLSVSWNLQNNKLCVTFLGTVIKIFDLQEY